MNIHMNMNININMLLLLLLLSVPVTWAMLVASASSMTVPALRPRRSSNNACRDSVATWGLDHRSPPSSTFSSKRIHLINHTTTTIIIISTCFHLPVGRSINQSVSQSWIHSFIHSFTHLHQNVNRFTGCDLSQFSWLLRYAFFYDSNTFGFQTTKEFYGERIAQLHVTI